MKKTIQQFSNKQVLVKNPIKQQPNNQQKTQQQQTIKKKIKKIFPQGGRLLKLKNMYQLEPNKFNKNRFAVQFEYEDPEDKKVKTKTVRFGKQDQEYFIDHQDPIKRDSQISRTRMNLDPFKKNFWNNILLQQKPSVQEAYEEFIMKNKLF